MTAPKQHRYLCPTVCDVLRTMSERLSVAAERFGDSRKVVSEILV
jgi:hypothetical protein